MNTDRCPCAYWSLGLINETSRRQCVLDADHDGNHVTVDQDGKPIIWEQDRLGAVR